ncbi:MAG: carbohydrate porin [Bacteroidota bacterium]|nr:carbohydrate porin [Bacteroidota bacterium]
MKQSKLFILPLLFSATTAFAQQADTLKEDRFSFHAQTTVISQNKPKFSVKYSGENSLLPTKESQTSLTSTFFLGARLWNGASLFFNPEIAGGSGLTGALGIGDATNGETFRVGDPAPKLYVARFFYRQLFALSDKMVNQQSDQNQLGGKAPEKYLSVTLGKIGIADYFDDNKYSHDPRTQFMAWSLMDNGAWDYPANTRGYTPSMVLEYVTPTDELRYAASLLPKDPNGSDMNWNIAKSISQSLEYTRRYHLINHTGAVRVLGFVSKTHAGSYRESLVQKPVNPDIDQTHKDGRVKYGFTLNVEQGLNDFIGCFARAGWNDGKTETWAFTEIDNTLSAGFSFDGVKWCRPDDNFGIAYVNSGLSKPHQDYLKAGGKGFMLGDGNLNYSREQLTELYYSAALSKNIFLTGTYQLLLNPGYNKDRQGPVNIFSFRIHVEI